MRLWIIIGLLLWWQTVVGQIPTRVIDELLASIPQEAVTPAPSYWFPTNIGSLYALWEGDSIVTNDTYRVKTWPDLSGTHILTNAYSATFYHRYTNNNLNGHTTVHPTTLNVPMIDNGYSVSQPHELWFVVSSLYMASYGYLIDGNSSKNQYLTKGSDTGAAAYAGTFLSTSDWPGGTNGTWYVLTMIFDGTRSRIMTNNVVQKEGNAGTAAMTGIAIGCNWGESAGWVAPRGIAAIATYSATNSVANQATIFSALTNRFNLSL